MNRRKRIGNYLDNFFLEAQQSLKAIDTKVSDHHYDEIRSKYISEIDEFAQKCYEIKTRHLCPNRKEECDDG